MTRRICRWFERIQPDKSAFDAYQPALGERLLKMAFRLGVLARKSMRRYGTAEHGIDASQRENEGRLQAILDNAPVGIILIDDAGTVETFNAAAERLFDIRAEEIVGRNVSCLMPEPHRSAHNEYLSRYQRTGEARVIGKKREVVGLRSDGSTLPLDLELNVFELYGVRRFIGILHDAAERKRAESERESLLASERNARATAQAANSAKDAFVALVAHELRTPLSAILNCAHVLRSAPHGLEAMRTAALDAIDRSIVLQSRIVEDLLDTSRVVSGKMKLDALPIDLVEVTLSAIETVRALADSTGVMLATELPSQPTKVGGDSMRLQQVFWNLLANAIKFSPSGGTVTIRLETRGVVARVTVEDAGEGISSELLPHVFDRYRQAERPTGSHHAGLGIGLALVRDLVELHGGTVGAASLGSNCGAVFTVELPLLT